MQISRTWNPKFGVSDLWDLLSPVTPRYLFILTPFARPSPPSFGCLLYWTHFGVGLYLRCFSFPLIASRIARRCACWCVQAARDAFAGLQLAVQTQREACEASTSHLHVHGGHLHLPAAPQWWAGAELCRQCGSQLSLRDSDQGAIQRTVRVLETATNRFYFSMSSFHPSKVQQRPPSQLSSWWRLTGDAVVAPKSWVLVVHKRDSVRSNAAVFVTRSSGCRMVLTAPDCLQPECLSHTRALKLCL